MALGWITLKSGDRISVFRSSPFFAVHAACLAALLLKFHWSYLVVCLALYSGRMFFVTAGYHRYFSHRSFKTILGLHQAGHPVSRRLSGHQICDSSTRLLGTDLSARRRHSPETIRTRLLGVNFYLEAANCPVEFVFDHQQKIANFCQLGCGPSLLASLTRGKTLCSSTAQGGSG